MNYCNPADYVKIISQKNNWPVFEAIFRRKVDFERHMEGFADFRNAIMHNRDLTEITIRSGELALVWLESVLPPNNGHDEQATDSDD